jgi:triosephosphate isomerase
MRSKIFAANWKMHFGPDGASRFMHVFLQRYRPMPDREIWFFPPAMSLKTVTDLTADRADIRAGAQDVYWEPKGAFTGQVSVDMVKESGGTLALVGHSERRHVFGETDEETGRKVRALLDGGLTPLLCVGEKIDQREAGETLAVVERQLEAVAELDAATLAKVPIAYEPVWAIGTGKTATLADAAEVHAVIRKWYVDRGVTGRNVKVLYGGSVKPDNAASLVSEPEIDGVLVGGASLDPGSWAAISSVGG